MCRKVMDRGSPRHGRGGSSTTGVTGGDDMLSTYRISRGNGEGIQSTESDHVRGWKHQKNKPENRQW